MESPIPAIRPPGTSRKRDAACAQHHETDTGTLPFSHGAPSGQPLAASCLEQGAAFQQNDINELKLILEHRENQWLQHCKFVLEKILLPLCREDLLSPKFPTKGQPY